MFAHRRDQNFTGQFQKCVAEAACGGNRDLDQIGDRVQQGFVGKNLSTQGGGSGFDLCTGHLLARRYVDYHLPAAHALHVTVSIVDENPSMLHETVSPCMPAALEPVAERKRNHLLAN